VGSSTLDAPKSILETVKTLETLSSGQIYKKQKNPKKTKNTKITKKTTGLVFFFNPGFFQPCLQQVGLVIRAGALRPLPYGDGGGGGGRQAAGGRERAGGRELLLLQVGEEGDVAALHQRLEGGRGLEGDKVLGPDEVGHLGRRVVALSNNNKETAKSGFLKKSVAELVAIYCGSGPTFDKLQSQFRFRFRLRI
jgi:hypothetical protein